MDGQARRVRAARACGHALCYVRAVLRLAIRGGRWEGMERLLDANLVEHRILAALEAPTAERFSTITARTVLLGGAKSPASSVDSSWPTSARSFLKAPRCSCRDSATPHPKSNRARSPRRSSLPRRAAPTRRLRSGKHPARGLRRRLADGERRQLAGSWVDHRRDTGIVAIAVSALAAGVHEAALIAEFDVVVRDGR